MNFLLLDWDLCQVLPSFAVYLIFICETTYYHFLSTATSHVTTCSIKFITIVKIMSLSGDGEGGIEMTESMELIREFCDLFITTEKATRTRIVWF